MYAVLRWFWKEIILAWLILEITSIWISSSVESNVTSTTGVVKTPFVTVIIVLVWNDNMNIIAPQAVHVLVSDKFELCKMKTKVTFAMFQLHQLISSFKNLMLLSYQFKLSDIQNIYLFYIRYNFIYIQLILSVEIIKKYLPHPSPK